MTVIAHYMTWDDMDRDFERNLRSTNQWADRVIVTDNYSRDGTAECALDYRCLLAQAKLQIPSSMWERLIHLSWRFVVMTAARGDWVVNLFGDEYADRCPVSGDYRDRLYKAGRIRVRHLWDLSENLERVDGHWSALWETRAYQYFPNEVKPDLRQNHDHPATHTRHVLPRYVEMAEKRGESRCLDATIYSKRYALDLAREGEIHREFSPMIFKKEPYTDALLMRCYDWAF